MSLFTLNAFLPLMPELFMLAAGIILLMAGVFRGHGVTGGINLITVLVLAVALCLIYYNRSAGSLAMGGMFLSTPFTDFAKGMLLIGTALVLLLSMDWLKEDAYRKFEYPVLVLFSVLGMMLLISSNHLMALYVGIELTSLPLYVLASIDRDNVRSTEAGLKYFVLGALASGMMLFGASLVYGFAGTLSFEGLAGTFTSAATAPAGGPTIALGVIFGMVLLIVGFCFKISAVPFHMWTPDVYEGSPTPVTALFAVAPKIAAITLFARVLMEPFGELFQQWQPIIIAVSMGSMIVGAIGGLVQNNIKRLLAYSSIGHVGYALIGLASGTPEGVQALLIYLSIYLVMSAGTVGCVLLMRRRGVYVEDIRELAGLSEKWPHLALAFSAFMFSMAGIPPLAGFFGKMYIFLAAMKSGLLALAIVGVLCSVVACFYYLRLVKIMYFDEAREPFDKNMAEPMRYVLAVCAAFALLFFLWPSPLVTNARVAAEALLP